MSTRGTNDAGYPADGAPNGVRGARFAVARTSAVRAASGGSTAPRSIYAAPIVTIFGAGIAGLSAAHELIERGFRVRVIEPVASEDHEYEAEVGGLARNQFGRAALYAAELADSLWNGSATGGTSATGSDVKHARRHLQTWLSLVTPARAERTGPVPFAEEARTSVPHERLGMMRAGTRHPFPERLVFTHPPDAPDADPVPASDLYDAANATKLALICARLVSAYEDSRSEIVRTLRAIGGTAAVERFHPEADAAHARLVLDVDLAAFTDAKQDEGRSYAVTQQVADHVRTDLLAANDASTTPIPLLAEILATTGMGAAPLNGVTPPTYLPPGAVWVELRLTERLLPGEHGYRYFPAFYRNLFEVMRRTPIVDDDGRVTAETAFTQLVPAPTVGFAFRGGSDAEGRATPPVIKTFSRRRAQSITELRQQLELTFENMRVSERDLLFYELQLLRYATSSTTRRREYEAVSWWDFLRGRQRALDPVIRDGDADDPRNGIYSEQMAHWLREIPQALIAMQSAETDARTYGTIVTQLLQGDLSGGAIEDFTLNGPTSVVWLRQWKRFLKRQGVDFFVGKLVTLEFGKQGELIPVVEGPEDDRPRLEPFDPTTGISTAEWLARRSPGKVRPFDDSDFFVLAVPIDVAARLARELRARCPTRDLGESGIRGDLGRLANLVEVAGIGDPGGVKRDHFTGRPSSARYPLRDFAGVQYFFPRRIGIGEGHIYYADAEWGLSSISQLAYWRDHGGPRGAFLGQISVDIGDWYAARELANGERLPAFRCPAEQIARGTWDQLVECLRKREGHRVPAPAFYCLDQAIGFAHELGQCTNATPFLISLPNQWSLRPGLFGPAREALGADEGDIDCLEDLYDARAGDRHRARRRQRRENGEIVYRVAHDRWLLAGTYMATYTRLTTMEAANESARHAVNGILQTLAECPAHEDHEPLYNSAGQYLGDPCVIANPEDNEWPDLEPLRRLDAALAAEGLPHVLDILRVPDMLARVPPRVRTTGRPAHDLTRLLSLAGDALGKDLPSLADGADAIGAQVGEQLRSLYAKLGFCS